VVGVLLLVGLACRSASDPHADSQWGVLQLAARAPPTRNEGEKIARAYFLIILFDATSNHAMGRSLCQSSTS
jgi:hypothetical protein